MVISVCHVLGFSAADYIELVAYQQSGSAILATADPASRPSISLFYARLFESNVDACANSSPRQGFPIHQPLKIGVISSSDSVQAAIDDDTGIGAVTVLSTTSGMNNGALRHFAMVVNKSDNTLKIL